MVSNNPVQANYQATGMQFAFSTECCFYRYWSKRSAATELDVGKFEIFVNIRHGIINVTGDGDDNCSY